MTVGKNGIGMRTEIRINKCNSVILVVAILAILPTLAMADDYVATGFYTGDGAASHSISGIGFRPDLVIVKSSEAKHAHIRTSSMPDGLSKHLAKNDGLKTDEIISLDADGFTVGDKNDSNDAGVEYHWVAMIAREGTMEVGQYDGNGNDFREIALNNMLPDAVLIMSAENKYPVFRHTDMDFYEARALNDAGDIPNTIAYFGTNKIVIRTGDEVNRPGDTYYYVT